MKILFTVEAISGNTSLGNETYADSGYSLLCAIFRTSDLLEKGRIY